MSSATTKLALLADVHGDLDALTDALRVIDDLGCDDILCAGDHVSYGSSPDLVIELLMERGVKAVCGNHDRWALDHHRRGDGRQDTFGGGEVREPASFGFLEDLPAIRRFSSGDVRFAICHGVPGNDMTEVLSDKVDLAWCIGLLERADTDILIVGHTHRPAVIEVGGRGMIVNPGALLRSPVANEWVPAPGTFGFLELPSREFEVLDAKSGQRVDVSTCHLG